MKVYEEIFYNNVPSVIRKHEYFFWIINKLQHRECIKDFNFTLLNDEGTSIDKQSSG